MPDLSIVIVSWNVRDLLAACLDSIRANTGQLAIEVIVVESGSSDDSLSMLQTGYPWVRVLPQTRNVGFTVGNNIGLAAATGHLLMLLNPDTEIIGNALLQMTAYLNTHPAIGVVGPRTLNSDGTTQSTKRRFPTLLTAVFESTWLQPFAPRHVLDRFYAADISDEATADVDWMQGSALMFRREVYEQIGGLDEHFVMFSEEVDFCKRIKDAGWRAVYLGGARIVHHGGKSTEQAGTRKQIYFQQSKLRYFRKHHGPFFAALLRLFLMLSYGQQLVAEWLKATLGHKRTMRQERVRVYWQVLRALTAPDH